MILICGTVEAGKWEIMERQCCVTKVDIFFFLARSELEQLVMWKVISYHIFEYMIGMPQTAENNENIINTLET